ncbi:MAG: DUF4321 domain-containing protein [Calditrichaeota bacterium]|nr:MAG: DUF4321 domain-containing protein [Calditrichota bacterium]
MAKKSLGHIVIVIILGAMIGTLLGELVTLLLPTGVIKEFFIRSASFAVGPATLDVKLFSITLGFTIKLNIVGIIGIGVALYLLRWY